MGAVVLRQWHGVGVGRGVVAGGRVAGGSAAGVASSGSHRTLGDHGSSDASQHLEVRWAGRRAEERPGGPFRVLCPALERALVSLQVASICEQAK